MNRIVLHIDRLVLRGIDPADTPALAAALYDALAQQLAAPGAAAVLPSLPAAARLRAGRVTLAADGDAGAHGQALGQAVARLLMPGVGT